MNPHAEEAHGGNDEDDDDVDDDDGETKGNAHDGAKRKLGHGHFMQTTTRTGPETRRQGVTLGAEKRRQGVTEKVWKGRGWRSEGGVRFAPCPLH